MESSTISYPQICRYYLRGICRFGDLCRYQHTQEASNAEDNSTTGDIASKLINDPTNWVNAPVFVPKGLKSLDVGVSSSSSASSGEEGENGNKSWAEVAGGSNIAGISRVVDEQNSVLCPYEVQCPYGEYCTYQQHGEICDMCGLFCLHPTDKEQRRKHTNECVQQHEKDMELSFAVARSKDKTCGICFDTIMEKSGREKRFGILPNCNHIFCLECIRKWRQAKQFEHKITRSCPECRVASDFVCPSAFWVETKEEKDKLLNDYRLALGVKDCKYFKKGEGKCPFGNKCFYKHALPDGTVVDVGCPQRRKVQRNTDELLDLLDIYLWQFVDRREYQWLDLLSNPSDTEESDYAEE